MTRVKICGITRIEDALFAAESGADYLGFIFAESPRRVTVDRAREIIAALPERVHRVGVFVNEEPNIIQEVADKAALTMIQLHGDEKPEPYRNLELPLIKVVHVGSNYETEIFENSPFSYILLEPYVPGKRGGSGVTADWTTAEKIVRTTKKKIFLAGGLGPHNVRSAVLEVRPFAVDGNSRLEDGPGIKNHEKVRRFIEEVRSL